MDNFKYNPPIFIHRLADVEPGATIGDGTRIWRWTHVMAGATIGQNCSIGQGCFIASTAIIGDNVRIQNGVCIYDGVVLESDTFVGPNVCFTNVKRPRSYRRGRYERTFIKRGAALGANCTIICGVTVGENAFVGAGACVTRDVQQNTTVWGVPARIASFQHIRTKLKN